MNTLRSLAGLVSVFALLATGCMASGTDENIGTSEQAVTECDCPPGLTECTCDDPGDDSTVEIGDTDGVGDDVDSDDRSKSTGGGDCPPGVSGLSGCPAS